MKINKIIQLTRGLYLGITSCILLYTDFKVNIINSILGITDAIVLIGAVMYINDDTK